MAAIGGLLLVGIGSVVILPDLAWGLLTSGLWIAFSAVVVFKGVCCLFPPASVRPLTDPPLSLPPYTVIVALKDEADVVPQLIRRLGRLDYPPGLLTGWLVVEPDDPATLKAIRNTRRPSWLNPLVAPPGVPQTKPRALNVALNRAEGGLLAVYDAEDEPHPEQLREAVERFASGGPRLACLQAPLRIETPGRAQTWLERQFAMEYAALFEVILPALSRLGLPLPLGGTSNHFKVDILKQVGGWDPWNVTEDADLGFRLARLGYLTGTLTRPTRESPPPDLRAWLPQRTRWLKGFMQTLIVHLRAPASLGPRGMLALFLTLGAAVAAAAFQGPMLAWISANLLVYGFDHRLPDVSVHDVALLVAGWGIAIGSTAVGSRRAGRKWRLMDGLSAPIYWGLTSIAQAHAAWRLLRQPHHWDKTPHQPDIEVSRCAERPLRIRDRLPTSPPSPIRTSGPWKFSISKTTPTSAPASSNVTAPRTSRECERPDA